jgi:methionyl-tRNA formyltransferase
VTVRLLFAGTPEVAVASLDALVDGPHDVVGVLTRPDAPAGRGRRSAASPVAARAAELGLPLLQPRGLRDPQVQAELRELEPDCAPVVAYGGLVPPALLDMPTHGWVNLHFSLLPAWRGAAPVQHAIMAGDDVTGATTFRLVAELDAGPVLGSITEPIYAADTAGDLLARLGRSGADLLTATVDGLATGRLQPVPQSADGVSFAPRLSADDAKVRWDLPAAVIDRRIRGCTPAPGAWTTLGSARLKLGPVRRVPAAEAGELASARLRVDKQRVLVGTGSGAVQLGEVQPQGKRPMAAADWARGLRLSGDERLGS